MPFRLIFKQHFQQQYLAYLLGAGITLLTMCISWKFKKSKLQLIWVGLFVSTGNILWYMSSVGSSWYLGQITAAFFLTAAIYESINKKRAFLVGIFLGAALLSRLHTILSIPIFLYFFYSPKKWFINYSKIGLGIAPFLIFNFYYNFIRFGVIWDKAYFLIPGLFSEPWFDKGLFHFSYIKENLKTMFLSVPRFSQNKPYIIPSWNGLSILLTSPAFIYVFKKVKRVKLSLFIWLSILPILLVVLSHGTTGFTQFGYRFAVDFYPLLFLKTILSVSENKLRIDHWLLLFFAIIVNLWGVLWINKFGWVGF